MGIYRFATLSDGSFVERLNSFKKHEVQLRGSQRALLRKTPASVKQEPTELTRGEVAHA
jgi:putative transposase